MATIKSDRRYAKRMGKHALVVTRTIVVLMICAMYVSLVDRLVVPVKAKRLGERKRYL